MEKKLNKKVLLKNNEKKQKRKYQFKAEKAKNKILYSVIFGLGITFIILVLSYGCYKIYTFIDSENNSKSASYCKSPYGYNNCRYAKNSNVKKIQQKLKELKYLKYSGSDWDDGNFGPETKKAVIAFQKAKKLNADGWVGPLTWNALFSKTGNNSSASSSTSSQNASGNITISFTNKHSTKVVQNTDAYINIKIANNSKNNYYYKWKTYANGNLAWDKSKCQLIKANSTKNDSASLSVSSSRFGRIYIYSDSSCSNSVTNKQTSTFTPYYVSSYNQGNSSWANKGLGCGGGKIFKNNGCFPTSVAIATDTFANSKVTPATVSDFNNGKYCQNGGYVSPGIVSALGSKYGFTSNYYSTKNKTYTQVKTHITNELSTGKALVIALLYCPKTSICSYSSGSKSHSVVAYPSTKDGYVTISDPDGGDKFGATLDQLIKGLATTNSNGTNMVYYIIKK